MAADGGSGLGWIDDGGGLLTATIDRFSDFLPRQQAKLIQFHHLTAVVTVALPEDARALSMLRGFAVRHIEGKGRPSGGFWGASSDIILEAREGTGVAA